MAQIHYFRFYHKIKGKPDEILTFRVNPFNLKVAYFRLLDAGYLPKAIWYQVFDTEKQSIITNKKLDIGIFFDD